MQTYSSLLLTSLLFTGIAVNSPQLGAGAQGFHQPGFETQSLTNTSSAQSDCRDSGQSPLPGCGRRDKYVTKGNRVEY